MSIEALAPRQGIEVRFGAQENDLEGELRGSKALSAIWAHCAPGRSHRLNGPSRLIRHQVCHPHQVIGRSHEVPGQPGTLHTPIPSAPEPAHRLHPPKDLLRLLANLLAHPIARMPCRPSIYRRVNSLRHVRRHPAITHSLHTPPRVIALVTSQRPGMEAPLPHIVRAAQGRRHAKPCPWPHSPRSPSAVRCGSPSARAP